MPLSDHPIHPTLPVSDLERARKFYESTLGFTPADVNPGGVFYDTGRGTRFGIYPSEFAGTNKGTAMGIMVPDIEAAVDEVTGLGVTFEQYPGTTNERGIADIGPTRAAWFKDPEGNIIGLVQLPE
jgi:catechol 2,3-dioxygenase-like lactoylglutathione lyase family enzyme